MTRALILVDLQNDFLPGGALAVPRGDEVLDVANRTQRRFETIVATQDWHPADHASFAANHPGHQVGDVVRVNGVSQVLWPTHCVQRTSGAALAEALDQSRICRVFPKGVDSRIDSYSGFFDNGGDHATGLGAYLSERGVDEVFVLGLATDYCVKFTALDARRLGFQTHLIHDGCRGVDLRPGDVDRAVREMIEAGVRVVSGELDS